MMYRCNSFKRSQKGHVFDNVLYLRLVKLGTSGKARCVDGRYMIFIGNCYISMFKHPTFVPLQELTAQIFTQKSQSVHLHPHNKWSK